MVRALRLTLLSVCLPRTLFHLCSTSAAQKTRFTTLPNEREGLLLLAGWAAEAYRLVEEEEANRAKLDPTAVEGTAPSGQQRPVWGPTTSE